MSTVMKKRNIIIAGIIFLIIVCGICYSQFSHEDENFYKKETETYNPDIEIYRLRIWYETGEITLDLQSGEMFAGNTDGGQKENYKIEDAGPIIAYIRKNFLHIEEENEINSLKGRAFLDAVNRNVSRLVFEMEMATSDGRIYCSSGGYLEYFYGLIDVICDQTGATRWELNVKDE